MTGDVIPAPRTDLNRFFLFFGLVLFGAVAIPNLLRAGAVGVAILCVLAGGGGLIAWVIRRVSRATLAADAELLERTMREILGA